MKYNYIPKQNKTKIMRRVALFYIYANPFNVWLDRGQLGSHICFCIHSIVIYV